MDSSDVELPPPPVPRRQQLSRVPFGRVTSKKRPFAVAAAVTTTPVEDDDLAAAFNTSSDPAIFSSEETPDLENYSDSKRRRKKVYSGTWWGRLRSTDKICTDKSHLRGKRRFERNLDSGIFMGDDSSSGPDLGSDPIDLLKNLSRDNSSFELSSGVEEDCFKQKIPPKRKESFRRAPSKITVEKSTNDSRVEKVVRECLQHDSADVDLTGMELSSLPSLLTELKTLIKPGSDSAYTPLAAELRLYLGNNSFTRVPPVVFQLDNLRVLSIRQNQLSTIPGAIRNLQKLSEINVSANNLQYLPYEVIEMFNGRNLQLLLDPNPWIPIPSRKDLLQDLPFLYVERNTKWFSLFRAGVQRATEHGPSGRPFSPASTAPTAEYMRSPYLTELALRKLLLERESAQDLLALYSDRLSENVKQSLESLSQCQFLGQGLGRKCTFCHRDMIQPRLSWLEWWSIDDTDTPHYGDKVENLVYDERPKIVFGDEYREAREIEPRPFLREACGCVSQIEGLEKEVVGFTPTYSDHVAESDDGDAD